MDLANKITIGIPIYNEEKYLKECLESAVKQNCTIIISDNCSLDNSKYICEEYQSKYSSIKYFRQDRNIGQTKNWKFVLDKADTPYFMWLGGHDYISESFAEQSLLGFTDEDIVCVFGDLNRIEVKNHESSSISKLATPSKSLLKNLSSNDPIKRVYSMTKDIHHANLFHSIIRTESLKRASNLILNNPALGGDLLILVKLAKEGRFIKREGFYHAYRDFTSILVQSEEHDPIERWIKNINDPESNYRIQGFDFMRRNIFYTFNSIPHDGTWFGKRKKSFYRKRLKKYLETHFGAYVYP